MYSISMIRIAVSRYVMGEALQSHGVINSDQYLLICMRYIELNPIRADMAAHPCDYPWSSYRVKTALNTKTQRETKEIERIIRG